MKVDKKLGSIDVLSSSCNISTVLDGRGAVFTWLPDIPVVEFNMLYIHANKVRGNHYHPEFHEYFLIVSGSVLMVTKDPISGNEVNMQASPGVCFRIPPNTTHAVHAITDAICISMLTKTWDSCNSPIIFDDLIGFNKDYTDFMIAKDVNYDPSLNTGKS